MSKIEISSQAQAFLAQPLLGRLATASPAGQPHAVPVWYLLEDGLLWISSYESTRKVLDIEQNPKCALVVDVEKPQDGITAVAIEGSAELVRQPAEETKDRIRAIYVKYLGLDGVLEKDPQTWLNAPENLLIKITPTRIKIW